MNIPSGSWLHINVKNRIELRVYLQESIPRPIIPIFMAKYSKKWQNTETKWQNTAKSGKIHQKVAKYNKKWQNTTKSGKI